MASPNNSPDYGDVGTCCKMVNEAVDGFAATDSEANTHSSPQLI